MAKRAKKGSFLMEGLNTPNRIFDILTRHTERRQKQGMDFRCGSWEGSRALPDTEPEELLRFVSRYNQWYTEDPMSFYDPKYHFEIKDKTLEQVCDRYEKTHEGNGNVSFMPIIREDEYIFVHLSQKLTQLYRGIGFSKYDSVNTLTYKVFIGRDPFPVTKKTEGIKAKDANFIGEFSIGNKMCRHMVETLTALEVHKKEYLPKVYTQYYVNQQINKVGSFTPPKTCCACHQDDKKFSQATSFVHVVSQGSWHGHFYRSKIRFMSTLPCIECLHFNYLAPLGGLLVKRDETKFQKSMNLRGWTEADGLERYIHMLGDDVPENYTRKDSCIDISDALRCANACSEDFSTAYKMRSLLATSMEHDRIRHDRIGRDAIPSGVAMILEMAMLFKSHYREVKIDDYTLRNAIEDYAKGK